MRSTLPMVLLDGYVRDRCPYVGDQAVSGMTLLVSTPSADPVLRSMILWYAQNQHADGSIPASPYDGGGVTLFDYNAYWVEDSTTTSSTPAISRSHRRSGRISSR